MENYEKKAMEEMFQDFEAEKVINEILDEPATSFGGLNKMCFGTAKADEGKPELAFVPPAIIEAVGRVRTYGNRKYNSPDNWRGVEAIRYKHAFMRHLCEWLRDDKSVDVESGLPHAEHMACNLAFLLELEEGKVNENI